MNELNDIAKNLPADPLWLEEIHDAEALAWVEAQSQRTRARFCEGADFTAIEAAVLRELDQDTRIPWVSRIGSFLYNLWQDDKHPIGLWRRTTLHAYRTPSPEWETVLDVDDLVLQEGIDWFFFGASALATDPRFCLLHLSEGGADACTIREFDLHEKRFVDDGFVMPVSKSRVSWIDQDSLYVADAVEPQSTNASGYPRAIKRWRRGASLATAPILFEASFEDVGVFAWRDHTPGFQRDFVVRNKDAYQSEAFMLTSDGQLKKIEIPEDARFSTFREWLLIKPVSAWTIGSRTYQAGQLLATRFDDYLGGVYEFTVLFTPSAYSALESFYQVGSHLVLSVLNNVVAHHQLWSWADDTWTYSTLESPGAFNSVSLGGLDQTSSDYFLTVSGFLQPPTLYLGNLNNRSAAEELKRVTAQWDLKRYRVNQHFAVSADGTRVPYFEISAADIAHDGSNRTLLYGYGGFQTSLRPAYLGVSLPAWLERGGVYVVANIRGGGEFGPAWHQAALRENRHRCHEDFAAVAQALIERKVTRSSKLGIRGASNGGLLMGNMLTHYPDLIGAVVCEVPLLDMHRYTQLLAGASWVAEYGDPMLAQDWSFLRNVSPYHNLRRDENYPPVLFLTNTTDDRVSPAHARKTAYRMQAMDYPQAYFYETAEGGHGGGANQKQTAFRAALVSEFLWQNLSGE